MIARSWRYVAFLLILTLLYFLAGKLGLSMAFLHRSASPVWPPTGLALAALVLFGYRMWPAIFIGAFLVNLSTAGNIATSIAISLGNTLESLLAAYLVNTFCNGKATFDTTTDIFRFVFLAGILSTAVSATIGVTSLCLGGFADWSNCRSIWITWWLGDASGAINFTPLLLLWGQNARISWTGSRLLEALVLLIGLFFVGQFVFTDMFIPADAHYPLGFLVLPFVIWAALRFGQREAATVTFITSAMAIYGTLKGTGLFALSDPNLSLIILIAFTAMLSVLGLTIAATVLQRNLTEAALERKAQALARSNAELEQFAYIASHDLQEPLRMVVSYIELLAKRYKQKLDQDGLQYIEFARGGAERMHALIRGLLTYSRVEGENNIELISLDTVFNQALANLHDLILNSNAIITHDPIPAISGHYMQLLHVFQNILQNAIKFRAIEAPRVHLSVKEQDGVLLFALKDNGIGIDSASLKEVFLMFRRLHKEDRYSGTGVGLAVCKRIVEKLGGEIWVESELGRGSTFFFSLPIKKAKST